MTSDYDDWGESVTYFEGPCTCEHAREAHGWGLCGQDECECEAGWTE